MPTRQFFRQRRYRELIWINSERKSADATMDIDGWLRGLGLGEYEAAFRENEIEADILSDLTELDLEKLGLPLGPRKRLLKQLQI